MRHGDRNTFIAGSGLEDSGPVDVVDVFLLPGDLYFGGHATRIRTLLGSCVSMVVWHPVRRLGGMTHFMLPGRRSPRPEECPCDGRYADEALELILNEIRGVGAWPREFRVGLYGGGRMFVMPGDSCMSRIGEDNARVARELMKRHGLSIHEEHLGGDGHRTMLFEVWTGKVVMRKPPVPLFTLVEKGSL